MNGAAPHGSQLLRWTAIAHSFTSTFAVLFGLMWVWSLVDDDVPRWYDNVNAVLFALLLVGGAAMGVLYLFRRRAS